MQCSGVLQAAPSPSCNEAVILAALHCIVIRSLSTAPALPGLCFIVRNLQGPSLAEHVLLLLQAVKQLAGAVAEMARLVEAADFSFFLKSDQGKCNNLWAAFERLHTSVVSETGDLIDESFRRAPCLSILSSAPQSSQLSAPACMSTSCW